MVCTGVALMDVRPHIVNINDEFIEYAKNLVARARYGELENYVNYFLRFGTIRTH